MYVKIKMKRKELLDLFKKNREADEESIRKSERLVKEAKEINDYIQKILS